MTILTPPFYVVHRQGLSRCGAARFSLFYYSDEESANVHARNHKGAYVLQTSPGIYRVAIKEAA